MVDKCLSPKKLGTEHGLFIFIVNLWGVILKELGEYLRQTRIKNGVSTTEAAEDLELSTSQLDNIESGNVKAFKDVYDLKEYIKQYAKYLGLDPDKVVDEFNGFLFEHTSKISIEDIRMAARKMDEKDNNKVHSPYTIIRKKKIGPWPFISAFICLVLLILLIYLVLSILNRAPKRTDELAGERNVVCEFTY